MSQTLPFDEINFDKNVNLEVLLSTSDESDIGYFIEVDLSYPNIIRQKTEHFRFAPEYKKLILMILVIF